MRGGPAAAEAQNDMGNDSFGLKIRKIQYESCGYGGHERKNGAVEVHLTSSTRIYHLVYIENILSWGIHGAFFHRGAPGEKTNIVSYFVQRICFIHLDSIDGP